MAEDGSDFARSMSIATSGLRAQAGRMRVISENIANADSTAPTAGGNPYRRKVPTFSSALDRTLDAKVVKDFTDKNLADAVAGMREVETAQARRTASAQRARSSRRPGSTMARGFHVAATSLSSAHVPVAMPARNAAPNVVASTTGDTSMGRPVASASAWTNVGLSDIPPSTAADRSDRSARPKESMRFPRSRGRRSAVRSPTRTCRPATRRSTCRR